ncbi:MAG: IS1380 family transposase, partial [Actinomycetota bacterium]|nr:IS1380 family transposase [Actinomycetota bacterium]
GEACSDIERLRSQPALFGEVASDSTLYRQLTSIDADDLDRLRAAVAAVRCQVWSRSSATTGNGPVVLDVDASLVDIHSENKEGTAANYKGSFGFAPMFCFADATGEALAVRLRPGNATANSIADQLEVVDDALSQLPPEIGRGHGKGDRRRRRRRAVIVRADSAGGTRGFAAELRARNVGFSVIARKEAQVASAISAAAGEAGRWRRALTQGGEEREGAAVAELTDLVDLSGWPEGTRLIVRREPLHPGAQTTLFPDLEFRYWGHYTDGDLDPVEADVFMRAHAHVEDRIKTIKASGGDRFPFADLDANKTWLWLVCAGADLVRWFQLLCLAGRLAVAEPKTLRWQLWHTPARVIRRARRVVVRVLDGWPEGNQLSNAYRRIALLA